MAPARCRLDTGLGLGCWAGPASGEWPRVSHRGPQGLLALTALGKDGLVVQPFPDSTVLRWDNLPCYLVKGVHLAWGV